MNWKGKTVLVTGAGGFIGSHLVEHLVALGARTRAFFHYRGDGKWGLLEDSIVKKEIEGCSGDVRDFHTVVHAARGADVVFHLAALIAIPYSYHTPLSFARTNVEGSLNVFQACRDTGVSLLIHTSTSEVYGTAQIIPIPETHALQGQSPYSATKIGADKLAEAFHLSFGLPVVTLRPFNTYGPRQSARAIIPTIVTQALSSDTVSLGSLSPTRDLNFVADMVEAYIKAAEAPGAIGQTINIGSGQETSVGDLAKTILRLIGKNLPILADNQRIRPIASEVQRLCADNRKAKQMLGWSPRYTLEDGLPVVIQWISQHLHEYKVDSYAV